MKCQKCGFEYQDAYDYCPNCGTATPRAKTEQVEAVSLNPAADKVFAALKDKLFLVVCILISASTVLSMSVEGLPVINILLTVFLWLTYASAQKGYADERQLRNISGTVYASYVVTNVGFIILIVCGAIMTLMFSFIQEGQLFVDTLTEELAEYGLSLSDIPTNLVSIAGWLMGFVTIAIGVAGLLINVLGMRKIHTLAKSIYQGIMYQNPNFQNPTAAKNWIMFFGVWYGLMAAFLLLSGNIVYTISNGCYAAAAIVSSVLINKYLAPQPYYNDYNGYNV